LYVRSTNAYKAYEIEKVRTQDINMTQITSRKVAFREPIFPQQPCFSSAEISQLQAENKLLADRCREVFKPVVLELIKEHYERQLSGTW
jgi:hypothetical protein